jgi:type 1 glutamine amidotransferase
VEERYLANVFGCFRACLEEHLPFTLVNDWNLVADDLAKFKVLVLPNAASIDDRQAEAVRKFVDRGGGLVASFDTSLCDEFGTPRMQIALADVLGIDHQGAAMPPKPGEKLDENFARTLPAEFWAKRKGVWDLKRVVGKDSFLESQELTDLIGRSTVTFKGPVSRIKPHPTSRILATVRARDDAKSEELPAMVTNSFGAGRTVYLAAGIDAAYYLTSYPYQRLVLKQAIAWAAGSLPPVEVRAPMCVHAVTMRQSKEGERLIVHLFNDVNTTSGHGLPSEEVPLREEVLPIHDIRVTFRDYRISRVHLEPGGSLLEVERAKGKVDVSVPRLDVHTMVVAELE